MQPQVSTGTEHYYDQRALEYDRVYEKPERQSDIAALGRWIADELEGRRVLELATGTGFWTARYADGSAMVAATDINESTLDVARGRRAWPDSVRFQVADAFGLDAIDGSFDALFAGFLWSHVPLQRLDDLVSGMVARLEPGARVVLADNNYVHGSNHPISRTDDAGNTYQQRALEDGRSFEVLKNFPDGSDLASWLGRHSTEVEVRQLEYYWLASFRTVVAAEPG